MLPLELPELLFGDIAASVKDRTILPGFPNRPRASSQASTQKSASMVLEARHDGTRREYRSMVAAKYM